MGVQPRSSGPVLRLCLDCGCWIGRWRHSGDSSCGHTVLQPTTLASIGRVRTKPQRKESLCKLFWKLSKQNAVNLEIFIKISDRFIGKLTYIRKITCLSCISRKGTPMTLFFKTKILIQLIGNIINTKTIGNRKKRLCVRLRSGEKHHLRKSSDRKAQINPASGMNAYLICAFRSEDFLRWCLSPKRNLTHNLFFLFPIVFGINLIHFFDEKKDSVGGNSIVCFGASIPCHAIWQR